MPTSRSAGLLLLLAAAGCASVTGSTRSQGSGVALGRTDLNPAPCTDESCPGEPSRTPPSKNETLDPKAPWIGQLGYRQRYWNDIELGFGLAVPKSMAGQLAPPEYAERSRTLGLGVWWALDF